MDDKRLYAIVLRLAALRRGAIPADHWNKAQGALLALIQEGDSPLAQRLHDGNYNKPYTVNLLQGGQYDREGNLHFGEGDYAEWRFTLMVEPAFEALLRKYLLNKNLPHVRLGAVEFGVIDAFASGAGHRDSGHISVAELQERWNRPLDQVSQRVVLEFCTPTFFSFGQDKQTKRYRVHSFPDARTLFSALRKKWANLGGFDASDAFDGWVEKQVELEVIRGHSEPVPIKSRNPMGFVGRVAYEVYDAHATYLPYLNLLADLTFWTGVGYQTTQGMGQVRRLTT